MNEKHMPCAYWREGEICAKGTEPGYTDFCVLGPCSQMKPSNGDHIRNMSDEELAEFIARQRFFVVNPIADKLGVDVTTAFIVGRKKVLDWLKQEVPDAELD